MDLDVVRRHEVEPNLALVALGYHLSDLVHGIF